MTLFTDSTILLTKLIKTKSNLTKPGCQNEVAMAMSEISWHMKNFRDREGLSCQPSWSKQASFYSHLQEIESFDRSMHFSVYQIWDLVAIFPNFLTWNPRSECQNWGNRWLTIRDSYEGVVFSHSMWHLSYYTNKEVHFQSCFISKQDYTTLSNRISKPRFHVAAVFDTKSWYYTNCHSFSTSSLKLPTAFSFTSLLERGR